jgi:fructokinase
VKLSDDDAAWIYPDVHLADVPELILGLGRRLVALTRGANSAVARSCRRRAGDAGGVADTVGAGDTFGAALIAALGDEGALGAGQTASSVRTYCGARSHTQSRLRQ